MTDSDLIAQALAKAEATVAEINRIYHKRGTLDVPPITFDLRGRVAGYAHLRPSPRIQINLDQLRVHTEDMINQTVPHEVAHLAAWKFFHCHNHGAPWQGIMLALGLEPRRCTGYSGEQFAVRKVPRPYVYQCACRTHHLTASLHAKARAGQHRKCRACRGRLKFVEAEGKLTLGDLGL